MRPPRTSRHATPGVFDGCRGRARAGCAAQVEHDAKNPVEAADAQGVHHGLFLRHGFHAQEADGLAPPIVVRQKDIELSDPPEACARTAQAAPHGGNVRILLGHL